MKSKDHKDLIVSLILDDLVHTRLIEGLADLGLRADDYCLDIGTAVVELMGFTGAENERLFAFYLRLQARARSIDLSKGNDAMRRLAVEIYDTLSRKSSG